MNERLYEYQLEAIRLKSFQLRGGETRKVYPSLLKNQLTPVVSYLRGNGLSPFLCNGNLCVNFAASNKSLNVLLQIELAGMVGFYEANHLMVGQLVEECSL